MRSKKDKKTCLSYCRVVIKVNAQKFFRIEVSTSWGHLIKEKKTLTKPEETIEEAKRANRDGIKKAWEVLRRRQHNGAGSKNKLLTEQ